MNPKASPRRRQLLEQLGDIHAQAVRDERATERNVTAAGGFGVAPLTLVAANVWCAARRARAAWLQARAAARSIAVFVLIIAAAAAAEHWQIDQPASWYRVDVSNHGHHAAAGAVIGVGSYVAVRAVGGDRRDAVAVGVVDGFLAGAAYELVEGRDGRSYVDPVDMAWTGIGSAVGAVTAAITDRAIGAAIAVIPHRDGVGLAIAKKF